MFVKFSALALCLSLVTALDIYAPLIVHAGTSVKLDVTTMIGGPPSIGILLCVADGGFDINLATSVAVATTINVLIPENVPARSDYFIAAIEVGNSGIIYSKSNLFEIERA